MSKEDRKNILLVEDDLNLGIILKEYLEVTGYVVTHCLNGEEGSKVFGRDKFDICLLDVMMPKKDGYTLAKEIREKDEFTPIIFLTAKSMQSDKIEGFKIGADDYVTKPFSMREVTARVRAVLRRMSKSSSEPDIFRVAEISLDRSSREVTVSGENVDLTPSEFDLLFTFMASPGRVFSRLDLLERLQGSTYEGYERTIDVHIRNLRTKIEPDASHPRYIETVYGIGYRFAPVRSRGS
jgi:DNA-binding response OmpR family regulator